MKAGQIVAGGILMISMTSVFGSDKAVKLEKGISAWTYGYSKEKAEKILEFNKKALPHLQFKYFFPYAGSLGFDPENREIGIWYNSIKNSEKYAKLLPGIHILPIIDARADKKEFNGWTDEEYKKAAMKTAEVIINDKSAVGVQIDIEPFQPEHLPFYRYLKEVLNKEGKYCTIFVGPKNSSLMKNIFESFDIVVLSGYDINGEGTPLEKYRKQFRVAVAGVDKIAKETNGRYMVGIPAAASWGEWEYKVDAGGKNRKDSGHKQEDYVKVCLEVLKDYKESPEYIGVSLWQLNMGERDEPLKAKKNKFPNYIRPSIWKMLQDY